MAKSLFVGNLPWGVGEDQLIELFRQYGDVVSARVILDRETKRSRGFGFVEVAETDVSGIISALNGFALQGRPLRVNEALPRS